MGFERYIPPGGGPKPLFEGHGKQVESLFQTVDRQVLLKEWKVVGRYRWKRLEGMPTLEARATLYAVKHALRSISGFHKRHLILSDSMSAICAVDRGRGKAFKLRRVTQQIGALLLCSGSSLSLRWVASEMNPADGPSRGSMFPSRPQSVRLDGDSSLAANRGGEKAKGQESLCSSQAQIQGTGLHTVWRQSEHCAAGESRQGGSTQKTAGGSRLSGGGVSGAGCSGEVSGLLEPSGGRHRVEVEQENQGHSGRRGVVNSFERPFSGRRKPQQGPIHSSSSSLLCSSVSFSQDDQSSNFQASHAGVAETGPTNVSVAISPRSGLLDGKEGFPDRRARSRADDALSYGRISTTGGVVQTEGHGSGSPRPRKQRALLESDPSSLRRRPDVESPGVRRDSFVRLGRAGDGGRSNLQGAQTQSSTAQQQNIFNHSQSIREGDDTGGRSAASRCTRCTTPIQASTYGGIQGLPPKESEPGRYSIQGAVEVSSQCKEISERWEDPATATIIAARRARTSLGRRKKAQFRPPEPALLRKEPKPAKVYIEIFSGCGRLASAVSLITGWSVLVWDILLGENYDLRLPSNRHKLGEWVRCGMVFGFHLGTPCESFTRARDVPPGPPPLRSDACPLGLPGLQPGDQLKVKTGNLWMRFTAWMLGLALQFGIWATLENPQQSRLWLCPPIASILRRKWVYKYVTHYCFWGMPFKKATTFVSVHFQLTRLEDSVCVGARRGICAFTGEPHFQLCGQDSQGRWFTKLAQPYPTKLCTAVAKCLSDAEVSRIASHVNHVLTR